MHPEWNDLTDLQKMALICARLVHDDLESLRAESPLPGADLSEVEQALPNSLYEALWVVVHGDDSEAAQEFLDYAIGEMPAHWPAPRFSEEFIRVVQRADGREPAG